MDFAKLLTELINGEVSMDGVTIKSAKELNISIKQFQGGIKVDFLSPEPTVSVVKIIRITDAVDYIRLDKDGAIFVKTKSWFSEIPINLSESA